MNYNFSNDCNFSNNSNVAMNPTAMFAKVAPGMCRMSMSGIAIKTPSGYKAYDVNTGKLVNCANFVFDAMDDIFFVIPTNVVNKGDIILLSGKPVCVISTGENSIKALRYEDSSIVDFVPESFIFFGTNYFYSKVVSMFGDVNNLLQGGAEKIMPLLFMSRIMSEGNGSTGNSKLGEMFAMSMMMNSGFNFTNMFGNMFDNTNNGDTIVNTDNGETDK